MANKVSSTFSAVQESESANNLLLGSFSTWMRIIGIDPSVNEYSNRLMHAIYSIIIRYGLWVDNLVSNIAQMILLYAIEYNEESLTIYWSSVIDYWNWTVHSISIHSWILLIALHKNKWVKLNKLLIKIEKIIRPDQPMIFVNRKKFATAGMCYLFFSVKNHFPFF